MQLPLVPLDDSVLFPWNHHKGPCFLIGLDRRTGEIAWKKDRPSISPIAGSPGNFTWARPFVCSRISRYATPA